MATEKDKGLMDAAKDAADKAPEKENDAAPVDEADVKAVEMTPSAEAAAKMASEYTAELDALRAELAAEREKNARPTPNQFNLQYEHTIDAARARTLFISQSESAARGMRVGEVPGGPVFSVPIVNPYTGEVSGYETRNGRGELVKDDKKKKG